jgi:RNA recognition motif-containing protein
MNIYVGNLARTVTEEQLKTLFSQFGTVVSAKLIKDKFTGDVRGFAFVQMSTHDEGLAAIAALDNTPFEGRTLRVNEARPREERPAMTVVLVMIVVVHVVAVRAMVLATEDLLLVTNP